MRFHLPSSRGTQSQTVRAERRIIFYSSELYRRYQKPRTSWDVMLEKSIDDHWNVDGDRELSDTWTSFTRFTSLSEKTTRWIFMVREETDKKTNDLQARHFVARNEETYVRCIKTRRKAKVGSRETKTRKWQKITWYLPHWSWRRGIQAYYENTRGKLEIPMPAAMHCKTSLCLSSGETCRTVGEHKTKHACIVEADKSMRIRMEGALYRYHEDHIAGKEIWCANLFLCLKQWTYLMRKQQWTKNGKNSRRYRHGSWRKSETKKKRGNRWSKE